MTARRAAPPGPARTIVGCLSRGLTRGPGRVGQSPCAGCAGVVTRVTFQRVECRVIPSVSNGDTRTLSLSLTFFFLVFCSSRVVKAYLKAPARRGVRI